MERECEFCNKFVYRYAEGNLQSQLFEKFETYSISIG